MEFKPGLFEDISNEDYHNGPGFSRTDLVLAKDFSPAHVKARDAFTETPAMAFGTAAHMAALEPDLFIKKYAVLPEGMTFAQKAGKEFRAKAEAKDKICLNATDGQKILAMMGKMLEHPISRRYLSGGKVELSGFWYEGGDSQLPCKIRLDYWNPDAMTIIDYKTARDARPGPFTKAAYAANYHVQAAWYRYGMAICSEIPEDDISFLFIVQEKEPPFEIQVYQADEELITEGLIYCQQALAILRECVEKDQWPGYPVDVNWLSLPEWVKRKNIFE